MNRFGFKRLYEELKKAGETDMEILGKLTILFDEGKITLGKYREYLDVIGYAFDSAEGNKSKSSIVFSVNKNSVDDESNLFEDAMKLAYDNRFSEAINMLSRISDRNSVVINNIGVCYERLNDYEKAAKYYLEAKSETSLENYVRLCDRNKTEYEEETYVMCCKELIKMNNSQGYLYLSYIMQKPESIFYNKEKAFRLLEYSVGHDMYDTYTLFELGFLYNQGMHGEKDYFKSHLCYSLILDKNDVAKYNYALQCMSGRGCEIDVDEAVKYFTLAALNGYKDAIRCLVEIYDSTGDRHNDELYNLWSDIREGNELSREQELLVEKIRNKYEKEHKSRD